MDGGGGEFIPGPHPTQQANPLPVHSETLVSIHHSRPDGIYLFPSVLGHQSFVHYASGNFFYQKLQLQLP